MNEFQLFFYDETDRIRPDDRVTCPTLREAADSVRQLDREPPSRGDWALFKKVAGTRRCSKLGGTYIARRRVTKTAARRGPALIEKIA